MADSGPPTVRAGREYPVIASKAKGDALRLVPCQTSDPACGNTGCLSVCTPGHTHAIRAGRDGGTVVQRPQTGLRQRSETITNRRRLGTNPPRWATKRARAVSNRPALARNGHLGDGKTRSDPGVKDGDERPGGPDPYPPRTRSGNTFTGVPTRGRTAIPMERIRATWSCRQQGENS